MKKIICIKEFNINDFEYEIGKQYSIFIGDFNHSFIEHFNHMFVPIYHSDLDENFMRIKEYRKTQINKILNL